MATKEPKNAFKTLTCGNPDCREEFLAELTIERLPTGELQAPALFPITCPTCESGSEHPGAPGVRTRFVRHFRPK
jgi:hypothetical protein